MAIHCPVGFDAQGLRDEVSAMYTSLARDPNQEFHFHRGPDYASSVLGYDLQALAKLPAQSTEVFAGVGNPHQIAPLQPGSTVIDIGCGGGMDLLLAAQAVGPMGRAIGLDMTVPMLERAQASIDAMGLTQATLHESDIHTLPLDDASVDHVISNGVLNLSTDKAKAFGEIFRIMRSGAHLQFADIIVANELPEGVRSDAELWAA